MSAAGETETAAEACSGCKFFRPGKQPEAAKSGESRVETAARTASSIVNRSYCRRMPQQIEKAATDWCGEFQPVETP